MSRRCHLCRSRAVGRFLLVRRPLADDDPRADGAQAPHVLPLCVLHHDLLAAAGVTGRTYPRRGECWYFVRQVD